jgi:DNA-binding CsgD family transcriptional regulator
MKNAIKILAALALLVAVALTVGTAFAEEGTPAGGPYSDMMVEAFAIETGKSIADIQTLKDGGKSYLEIAKDLGYAGEDLQDLMERVSDTVIELAVEAGMITQEVADKITERERRIGDGDLAGKFLEKLGLTPGELAEMIQSGMTLQEIMLQLGYTPGGHLAEKCGLSREEIITRIQAGETLKEVCPGLMVPPDGWPRGNRP